MYELSENPLNHVKAAHVPVRLIINSTLSVHLPSLFLLSVAPEHQLFEDKEEAGLISGDNVPDALVMGAIALHN